jgi:hypothetical protein
LTSSLTEWSNVTGARRGVEVTLPDGPRDVPEVTVALYGSH